VTYIVSLLLNEKYRIWCPYSSINS